MFFNNNEAGQGRSPCMSGKLARAIALSAITIFGMTALFNSGGAKQEVVGDYHKVTKFQANPSSSLQALCSNTKWTDGLYLHCHNGAGPSEAALRGGLNNARNRLQACIRLAISAGAGIIIAPIATRSEGDLFEYPNEQPASNFFDVEGFQTTMASMCPQMKSIVYSGPSSIEGLTTVTMETRGYLEENYYGNRFRDLAASSVYKGSSTTSSPEVSSQNPMRLVFGDPYVAWNYTAAHEPDVRNDLFQALRYNPTKLRYGAKISEKLNAVAKGPVVAIHYRAEDDWPNDFGNSEMQTRVYLENLKHLQDNVHSHSSDASSIISDVYISCGDKQKTEELANKIREMGLQVHDKYSLLADDQEALKEIDGMSFDGKAIVEYETLRNADHFFGLYPSTLSDIVAYSRGGDALFQKYMFPDSFRDDFISRKWSQGHETMRGDGKTNLIIVNGPDVMDAFP